MVETDCGLNEQAKTSEKEELAYPTFLRLAQVAQQAKDMGGQIVGLIDSFTDQANHNSLQQNKANLQELKDLKKQVDAAKLGAAQDLLSGDEPAGGADEESSLVSKIKSKDQLIKEIDAQIGRLDALDGTASAKKSNKEVPSRKHRATPSLAKASRVEKQLKSEVSDLDHFLAKVSSLGTETGLVEPVEPVAPVDSLLPKSHGTTSMEVEQQVFTKAAAGTDLDSSASHNAVTAPAHDAPELDSIDWEDSESGGIAKRNFVESSIEQAIKIRKLEQLIGRLEDSSK